MRISDWSSDVCSSDLVTCSDPPSSIRTLQAVHANIGSKASSGSHKARNESLRHRLSALWSAVSIKAGRLYGCPAQIAGPFIDRTSVVSGKSVSVRVDLGGRRILKKKQQKNQIDTQSMSKY